MSATCLIAEADPFIANLLLRFAEESGLNSVRAKTGQEILALVRQLRPDVLIIEPELPGELRGWEVVRALRSEVEEKDRGEIKAEGMTEAVVSTSIAPLTSTLTSPSPLAVISCSWLEKTEAHKLLGAIVWHLQKPNLYYGDFVKALEAAGVAIEEHTTPR